MDRNVSRRTLLQAGALGGVVGVAGCAEALLEAIDEPVYRQWLAAPRAFDTDHYRVQFLNVNGIDDNRTALDRSVYDDVRNVEERFPGIEFDQIDRLTAVGVVRIVEGEFDVDEVDRELEDEGFSRVRVYEGLEIYEEDRGSAFGISDDAAISVPPSGARTASEFVEIFADAREENVERYHEADRNFEALTDELGFATMLVAQTNDPRGATDPERGQFENNVGFAYGWNVDGGTSDFTVALAFESAGDVVLSDVEEWAETSRTFEDVEDVDIESEDALAIVTGTADTADVDSVLP